MTMGAPVPAIEAPLAKTEVRSRTRSGPGLGRVALHISLLVLMAIWAIPTIALLVASFRPAAATNESGWWTAFTPPWQFTIENYEYVLGRSGIDQAFINSFIITIPATVLVVLLAAFAAYAFAWMEFPGRNILFVVVVGLLVVPLQVTLIPVLSLLRDFQPFGLKINGTMLAVWLAHTGYGLPFAVYLLRNYFGGLPREVFESAAIDGVLPPGHPDECAGPRLPDHLPVPVGLERPARRARLHRARAGEPPAVGRPRQSDDVLRWRLAVPDGSGVRLDDRPDHRFPQPAALLRPWHHRCGALTRD